MSSKWIHLCVVYVLAILSSACDHKVESSSSDSTCIDYTDDNLVSLKQKGDLASARLLRDMLLECDLTKTRFEEALYWAKIAADQGGDEDRRVYEAYLEGSQRPRSNQ